MSPLYSVIFTSRCTSNHHRIAVDALRHLRAEQAPKWANLLLHHHEAYLKGAKAPDEAFKDFKNHVLHVGDGYWGGAAHAAAEWYAKTVAALAAKKWKDAAYNAGVLSHYVVDPIQPFHTGQSETENVIHRAVEQSFSKSYSAFQQIIEAGGGYADMALPSGPDWLIKTVRAGADAAHPHYDAIIDHYDFKRGAKKPPEGMDDALRAAIAPLVARAVITYARVLDRAIEEAGVKAPFVVATLDAFFANMTAPIAKIAAALADGEERAYVLKMYKEYVKTGKVAKTLPEDDRAVRALYAAEVLKVDIAALDAEKPRAIGAAHGQAIAVRANAPARAPSASAARIQAPTTQAATTQAAPMQAAPMQAAPMQAAPTPPAPSARVRGAQSPPAPTPPASVAEPKPKAKKPPKAKADPAPAPGKRERTEAAAPTAKEKRTKKATAPERAYDPDSPFAVLAQGAPAARTEEDPALLAAPPIPPPPPGVRLHLDDHIVDAPAIGPKAAARFEAIGFKTVADLLEASPEDIAKSLRASHMTPPIIRDWQAQALLACTVPNVRSIDAQALIAGGVRDIATLAKQDAKKLAAQIDAFFQTPNGRQLARSSKAPSVDAVRGWIEAAKATPKQASVAA